MILLYDEKSISFFKRMFTIGVTGIIRKEATINEMETCIDIVIKGGMYIENILLKDIINPGENSIQGFRNGLTLREKLIANLLVNGKSNKQICPILKVQPSTVSTYKNRIYKKLQITNLFELEKVKNEIYIESLLLIDMIKTEENDGQNLQAG